MCNSRVRHFRFPANARQTSKSSGCSRSGWASAAQSHGIQVTQGNTAGVGSIAQWNAGHVAYVEAVNADGSWTVSEMNFVAFGVISQRTIKPGQLGSALVGFIY